MKRIVRYPLKLSKKSAVLSALAAFALSTSSAFAQGQCIPTTTWIDSTGNWFTAANWNNGVPTSSFTAQINNGGTAQITGGLATANACTLNIGPGSVSVDGSSGILNVVNSVTVGSSGTSLLALGYSATVNAGSISVGKSGTLQFDVIPATTGTVNVTPGTATLNATSTVKVTMTGTFTPGTQYILVTATGGVSGTFGTNSITYPHGQGFIPQITYDATHVYLYLVPVPGP